MKDRGQVWHYGLMAERWAEVLTEAPELDFLQAKIDAYGQPVLDLACGTGRLLLPLLTAGVDIDGADVSADMLAHCRRKAADLGYQPTLFEQSMHKLDSNRRYGLIFICGSIGLAGTRENDLETLRRCFAHLKQDGALVLNIQAEYTWLESWQRWATEKLSELPEPWPETGRDKEAADGTVHRAYFRLTDLNPLEQIYTRQVRLEKWADGEKLAEEEYTLQGNMYLKNEIQLMLEVAGFESIRVFGEYTDQLALPSHEELVFVAEKRKP